MEIVGFPVVTRGFGASHRSGRRFWHKRYVTPKVTSERPFDLTVFNDSHAALSHVQWLRGASVFRFDSIAFLVGQG